MSSSWQPVTSTPQLFTFLEQGDGPTPAVVYFTAPWCFRCKQVATKLGGFPGDFPYIRFLSVDLEECEELGELLDVATLPSFLLFFGGREVHRLEGVPQQRPAKSLAQAIRQHLPLPSQAHMPPRQLTGTASDGGASGGLPLPAAGSGSAP